MPLNSNTIVGVKDNRIAVFQFLTLESLKKIKCKLIQMSW